MVTSWTLIVVFMYGVQAVTSFTIPNLISRTECVRVSQTITPEGRTNYPHFQCIEVYTIK